MRSKTVEELLEDGEKMLAATLGLPEADRLKMILALIANIHLILIQIRKEAATRP